MASYGECASCGILFCKMQQSSNFLLFYYLFCFQTQNTQSQDQAEKIHIAMIAMMRGRITIGMLGIVINLMKTR